MIDAQGDDPGCQHPDLVSGEGAGIIEKTQLQDERCILDGFHVDPVDGFGKPSGAHAHEPQQDAQYGGDYNAPQGTFHRHPQSLEEAGLVGQDHFPCFF